MKINLSALADSLQKYVLCLKHQNEVVSANHEQLDSVRDSTTSTAPQVLPTKPAMKAIHAAKFEIFTQELIKKEEVKVTVTGCAYVGGVVHCGYV